jgi:ergothioneine biosynthesis protein EgtB
LNSVAAFAEGFEIVPALSEPEARESAAPADLQRRLAEVRRHSLALAEPLSAEDQVVQPMDDASPTKWHLAHVTWFFETFVLEPHLPGYRTPDPRFAYCFNSYYEAAGPRHPRPRRGLLTRPTHREVLEYRAHVDEGLGRLFARGALDAKLAALIELGINHEQQHQELILTDILALFAAQPLRPAYRPVYRPARKPALAAAANSEGVPANVRWLECAGGIHEVGHRGASFFYDNERPSHDVLLRDYRLADRLVTNADWLEFIADGGYSTPEHWLSDGWAAVNAHQWRAPGYWEGEKGEWRQMTLEGLLPIEPQAPVCHVSYFEADAFARWAGKRLLTEFEWEVAAAGLPMEDGAPGGRALRPRPVQARGGKDQHRPLQMFGEVWQFTQSPYSAYPGFRAGPGAIGEYNGKFMNGQYVLRGASCVTPEGHSRATYRNFFYPHQRWQFTGLRLADDA